MCERSARGLAIAEVVAIASESGLLRVDLLEAAAGAELGGWQHSQVTYWAGRDTALLLVAAGADPERVKALAVETRDRLGVFSRPGIGNPN